MLNPVKYKVGSVVNPIKSCVGQGRCGNVWGGGLGESERLIVNVTLIYEHNPLCGPFRSFGTLKTLQDAFTRVGNIDVN